MFAKLHDLEQVTSPLCLSFPICTYGEEGLDNLVVLSGSVRPGLWDLARILDLSTEMAEVLKLWLTPSEKYCTTDKESCAADQVQSQVLYVHQLI